MSYYPKSTDSQTSVSFVCLVIMYTVRLIYIMIFVSLFIFIYSIFIVIVMIEMSLVIYFNYKYDSQLDDYDWMILV